MSTTIPAGPSPLGEPCGQLPAGAAASPFDGVLDRATARLTIDPELRLEVRHELRTHLEAAAAEHRAAGVSDAEAVREAEAALGDPTALADQLWTANRRRVSLRRAAWWAVDAGAAPIAAVLTVALAWQTWAAILLVVSIINGHGAVGTGGAGDAAVRRATRALVEHVAPERRAAVMAVVPQEWGGTEINPEVHTAGELSHQYPDDPAYVASYARALSIHMECTTTTDGTRAPRFPEQFAALLTATERGAALEPDNGFFPLVRAAALFERSVEQIEPGPFGGTGPAFTYTGPDGKPAVGGTGEVRVVDPEGYADALRAFEAAARCAYVETYTLEPYRRAIEALPPPDGWWDQGLRERWAQSILLPTLVWYRTTYVAVGQHARSMAADGNVAAALVLIDRADRLANALGANAEILVELLVARGLVELTLANRVLGNQAAGRTDAAAADLRRYEQHLHEWHDLRAARRAANEYERIQASAGMLLGVAGPASSPGVVDFGPARRAEYALLDRTALTTTTTVFLAVVLGTAVFAAIAGHRARRPDATAALAPVDRLTLRWSDVAAVVVGAVVLPLAVYGVYTRVEIVSGRVYGLPMTADRLLVEYLAVLTVVVALFHRLHTAACRRRASELGLRTPTTTPRAGWRVVADVLLAAIVAGYLVTQTVTFDPVRRVHGWPAYSAWGVVVAGLILIRWVMAALPPQRRAGRALGWMLILLPVAALASTVVRLLWDDRRPLYRPDATALTIALWTLSLVAVGARLTGQVARFWRAGSNGGTNAAPFPLARARAAVLPAVCGALVAAGIAYMLRDQEQRAARRFDEARLSWVDEVETSAYRPLRDEMSRRAAAPDPPAPSAG